MQIVTIIGRYQYNLDEPSGDQPLVYGEFDQME